MAFEGLLGGGGGDPLDLYGDLFSDKQKAALRQRELSQGLLSFAAKLGALSAPSRVPQGSLLGSLGQALGGFAPSDDAANKQLEAMSLAEKVRLSKQQRDLAAKTVPFFWQVAGGNVVQSPQGVPPAPGAVPLGPAPAAPGAPTGGPLASNAPPPPPIGSSPADYLSGFTGAPGSAPGGGDFPGATAPLPSQGRGMPAGMPAGGVSGSEWLPNLPQQTGLLPPPPGANPQMGQGGGLLAGLPFDQTAPGAGGVDLSNIRIEPLSGEAAPAGVDLPFPTRGNPNKPKSAWEQGYTYEQPKVPFGQDPGDVGPGAAPSELARLSQLMRVETLAKPAAAAPSNLTGSNWEVANNNLGGMRRPGVNASPSQGGFQTFATPEAGLAAISNQLDRYASGATTGKPLSTIREIVSTWAPPSENDTEALIKRATRIMGVADNIPLNVRDPAVKAKLIEATVRNEQGGKLPVDPNLISQVAQAPPGSYAAGGQDTVIPSGRGIPASALQRVADTGGGPPATPPGAGTPSGGVIPGLNMTPQQLGAFNALFKMSGMGDPFGSLLETYYKSPGYLAEKARTEAQAQKDVALKMDPLIEEQNKRAAAKVELEYKPQIEEAVQKLQSPILKERAQAQADIDRISEELKQNRIAALTPTDATIAGPDGQPVDTKISAMDLVLKQKDRADRIAKGDLAIRPGDVLGKPALSPQETARQQEAGKAPYTSKEMTLTWPDGETRKVTLTGEQAKDAAEGKPVPAIGWPGTIGGVAPGGTGTTGGGRVGEVVYPPGYAEATTNLLEKRRPKAEAAVQSLNFNDTAQRLLDSGIISGWGATLRLDAAKAKSLLGWGDQRIANTEAFLATQARQVASQLASGAFGSGSSITDNDRQYAAKLAGGDSNLDEASLRFLLRQNQTAARWEIDRYNADVQRHDPKGQLPILRVPEPTKAEAQPSANQPTVIGRSQLGDKPYIKWSDGKWRAEGELPGQEKQ